MKIFVFIPLLLFLSCISAIENVACISIEDANTAYHTGYTAYQIMYQEELIAFDIVNGCKKDVYIPDILLSTIYEEDTRILFIAMEGSLPTYEKSSSKPTGPPSLIVIRSENSYRYSENPELFGFERDIGNAQRLVITLPIFSQMESFASYKDYEKAYREKARLIRVTVDSLRHDWEPPATPTGWPVPPTGWPVE